jgi:hypothetical protein
MGIDKTRGFRLPILQGIVSVDVVRLPTQHQALTATDGIWLV